MQKFSLHTHTLGFDGHNTEEQMVQLAKQLGWTHIGISNHFIVHPRIKRSPMYPYAIKAGCQGTYSTSFKETIEKFKIHYKKIDELQQKNNSIKILKGMEVDFFTYPEWREKFEKAVTQLKPDYLIGSAHFVDYGGILYNSHQIAKASPTEQNFLLHRYWKNVRAAAQSGLFSILAHLDVMKKAGVGTENKWIEEEQKTIQTIKQYGICVEINTSYYSKGSEPYPSPRIMSMLSAANIPVIISDDAHSVSEMGKYFNEAELFANRCGLLRTTHKRTTPKQIILANMKQNTYC